MQWENVYIFISSTFNDMHAERDYLVKKVFPQFAAWCDERKLHLIDIDLRWGVSESDATQNKRVVQVCLDRIDASRPFFICFLGQRRGWVPGQNDISDSTYDTFKRLQEGGYAGNASVTEIEILHALIDPLHNGLAKLADGKEKYSPAVEHAFFYLRDNDYLDSISDKHVKKIYTNETDENPERANSELKRWREEIIPKTCRPISKYSGKWDTSSTTPEISWPYSLPTSAPKGSPEWERAYQNWKKQWDDVGVVVNKDGTITGDEIEKAINFNNQLTTGRLSDFTASDSKEKLSDVILEQLKEAVTKQFGERTQSKVTHLQNEIDQQAQFLHMASEGFIEREGDFDAIKCYLNNFEKRPLAITAEGGIGKTSLLAHFIDTYEITRANESIHYRFIGASDDSITVDRMLRSLWEELYEANLFNDIVPADVASLLESLPQQLTEAGRKGPLVLVIDALNQLETGMVFLSWIPRILPDNVKLIVSFKRGEPSADEYYEYNKENETFLFLDLKPMEDKKARRLLVDAYLNKYFKELDDVRVDTLISSEGAQNPLFLKIVLSELRVFGSFQNLGELIKTNFGNTPVSAYDAVLKRLEEDIAYTKISSAVAIPNIFAWLSHSRMGLSPDEIAQLMLQKGITSDTVEALETVYQIIRQLRPYLSRREGRIVFFFESFQIAALKRYTERMKTARASSEWHSDLANYFSSLSMDDVRRLQEEAFHLAHSGNDSGLSNLLWSYSYINSKLDILGISQLIGDYDLVKLPEVAVSHEETKSLLLLQHSLELSAQVLSEYPEQLAEQLFGRLVGKNDDRIIHLLSQASGEKTEPWIRPNNRCFGSVESRLITTRSLEKVYGMLISSDNRYVVTCSSDGIKFWNPENFNYERIIPLPTEHEIDLFLFSDNGKYIFLLTDRDSRHYRFNTYAYIINYVSGEVIFRVKSRERFEYRHIELIDDNTLLTFEYNDEHARGAPSKFTFETTVWDIKMGVLIRHEETKDTGLPEWAESLTEYRWTRYKSKKPVGYFKDENGNPHSAFAQSTDNSAFFEYSKLINVWDSNTHALLETITPKEEVTNGVISGDRLFTYGSDLLCIYDVSPPFINNPDNDESLPSYLKEIRLNPNVTQRAFSLLNCTVSNSRKFAVTLYGEYLFDPISNDIIFKLPKHVSVYEEIENVVSVAFSPDESLLVRTLRIRTNNAPPVKRSIFGQTVKPGTYHIAQIFSTVTGQMQTSITLTGINSFLYYGLENPVRFYRGNDKLQVCYENSLTIWDVESGKPDRQWMISDLAAINSSERINDDYELTSGVTCNSIYHVFLIDSHKDIILRNLEVTTLWGRNVVAVNGGIYYFCRENNCLELWDVLAERQIAKLYSSDRFEKYGIENSESPDPFAEMQFVLENLPAHLAITGPSSNCNKFITSTLNRNQVISRLKKAERERRKRRNL